jgi:hypothetical protein
MAEAGYCAGHDYRRLRNVRRLQIYWNRERAPASLDLKE